MVKKNFDILISENSSKLRRRGKVFRRRQCISEKKVLGSEAIRKAIEITRPKNKVVDLKKSLNEVKVEPAKNTYPKSNLEKKEKPADVQNILVKPQKISPHKILKPSVSVTLVSRIKKTNLLRPAYSFYRKRTIVFRKSVVIFTLCALFLSFSVHSLARIQSSYETGKKDILGNVNVAYQYITSASNSLGEKDYNLAGYKFGIAADRFFASEQEIKNVSYGVSDVLSVLPGGGQVAAAENLLIAGGKFSEAGEYASKALEPFTASQDVFEAIKKNPKEYERKTEFKNTELSLTEALVLSTENLGLALQKVKEAENALNKVDLKKLPPEIASKVKIIKEQTPPICRSLDYFLSYSDFILEVLGHYQFKRYLLLFQNNTELRATGGFIGTYGLLDLNEGKITNLKVEEPYNLDGQMKEKIIAPEALHLINERFYMRDGNWFPDFPTSAKKVASLHEKTGGPTVDGVISFNAQVIIELLKITGPVEVPDYEVTITAENFLRETQREVEIDYDRKLNRPKKFVSDLIPLVLNKIFKLEKKEWIKTIILVTSLFEKKEIMLFFYDDKLENKVREMGFSGELADTSKDYLNIVAANIGGGKTDYVISQKAELETNILPDGSIINTLIYSRTHNGVKEDFWTRVKNMSYVRFYVPKGSTLLRAEGFDQEFFNSLKQNDPASKPDELLAQTEGQAVVDHASGTRVYEETGKTVFGNIMAAEAGMNKTVELKYKLPFKVIPTSSDPVADYSLYFEKQSGATVPEVKYKLSYPAGFNVNFEHFPDLKIDRGYNELKANFLLEKDKILAVIFTE